MKKAKLILPLFVISAMTLQSQAISTSPQTARLCDLLIRNGRVLDGSGNPWNRLDVGITDNRITFVGNAQSSRVRAAETLDAKGMIVAPGFIDTHSHLIVSSEAARTALPFLHQGITSAIVGNDGGGHWQIAETSRILEKQGIAINVGLLVGHAVVRRQVLGMANRAPTGEELEKMKQLVRTGIEQGAVGFSTDLFDAPGNYASTAEVIELGKQAARYGGYYDTHIRDEGVAYPPFGFLNAIREAIEISEKAAVRVNISHIHPLGTEAQGLSGKAIELIEDARQRGLEITADQYPYDASMNSLAAVVLPRWAQAGGSKSLRERLSDSAIRARLEKDVNELIRRRGGPDSIVMTQSTGQFDLSGKSLARLTREWKVTDFEVVRRVLQNSNPFVVSHNQSLADVAHFASQEWVMGCTDAFIPVFGEGQPHPRAYGAFPRKFRLFVREHKTISLPFAVRSMTSLPATLLRLKYRGMIREDYYADIVVFDENRITDRATYEQPHQYAEGIVHVLVNGRFAVREGRTTGTLAGAFLHRENDNSRSKLILPSPRPESKQEPVQ